MMKTNKMKTKYCIFLFSLLLLCFILQKCTLFKKDEKILAEHKKSNGETIRIYYVGLGATTNEVIQVRKINHSKPLNVFENYNYLKSSRLINDTLLQLILSDTGYYQNSFDTIIVNIK